MKANVTPEDGAKEQPCAALGTKAEHPASIL